MSQTGSYVSLAQGITTLTGNAGGAVAPVGGNLTLLGSGDIVVTGNPGTHTLTITGAGVIASTYTTDSGNAVPAGGVLNVLGTTGQITTAGAGNTITLALASSPVFGGTITAATFATSNATDNLLINANNIVASGSDTNVNIVFTTQGTGTLVFRGLTSGFTDSEWITGQADLQTTNATPTPIISIPIAVDEMVTLTVICNGFVSNFVNCLGGQLIATAYRPTAGNVTLVGAATGSINYTDLVDTTDITIAVNVGTQSLNVLCTGVAGQTFNWVATYSYMYLINNL